MGRTILFVTGIHPHTRAKALAYEFQRYGRLVRCDIPALRSANAKPYAFVEFRYDLDAEDAYYDMHRRVVDGRELSVQWAKSTPSSSWRYEASDGNRTSNRRQHQKSRDPEREREERDARYQERLKNSRQDPDKAPPGWRNGGRRGSRCREQAIGRDMRDRSFSPRMDRERRMSRSRSRSRNRDMDRNGSRGRGRGMSPGEFDDRGRARSSGYSRNERHDIGSRSPGRKERDARPASPMEEAYMNG